MHKIYFLRLSLFLFAISLFAVAARADYPQPGSFDGYYAFHAGEFSLDDSAYAEYFTPDFVFQIQTFFGTDDEGNEFVSSTIANSFLYPGLNLSSEYDPLTGRYDIRILTIKPFGSTYLGIAPVDGGWKGMSALTGNFLSLQIGEDGSISIPDFDIITFSGVSQTGTVASYSDITVTPTDAPEVEGPEWRSFEGVYPLTGTKFEYPDGDLRNPVATEFSFNLVINANNQITSIAGYTLSREEIEVNLRNRGVVSGNSLVFEAAPFLGVKWEMTGVTEETQGFMEAWLLGGPDANGYNQLSERNKVVFTLEDDGSYYLEPFTLWWRHQVVNENENNETVFDLIFKWEQDLTSGVDAVVSGDEAEVPLRWFNLQGVEVSRPVPGQIYIEVGRTSRVVRF